MFQYSSNNNEFLMMSLAKSRISYAAEFCEMLAAFSHHSTHINLRTYESIHIHLFRMRPVPVLEARQSIRGR